MRTLYSKIELLRACIQAVKEDKDTVRKIADKTGIQKTQIGYLKQGLDKNAGYETLFRLARFYNIPYDFSSLPDTQPPEPLTPEEQIRKNFVSCLSCSHFKDFKCMNPESILNGSSVDQTTVCKKFE